MRVTNNMITRNYLKSLNSNMTSMNNSMKRINSGRRFTRISENLSDGARALRIRDQLSDCNEQKAAIRDAEGWTDTAESHLRSVNDILVRLNSELALKASNDPSISGRKEIGNEMHNLKEQMVQILNSKYADRNMFSSSYNKDAPFTVEDDKLFYNGVDIETITKSPEGKYVDANGKPVPGEEALFVDMGIGMTFVNGEIDERTAYKYSFSGLDMIGHGQDNLFSNITKMEKMLTGEEPYDGEAFSELSKKVESGRKDLMLEITELGNRQNYLEGAATRLEGTIENLTKIRGELEGTDDAAEITKLNMYRYSWMATLQMGSDILPKSLLDYLH